MNLMRALGHRRAFLITQTPRIAAILTYRASDFAPTFPLMRTAEHGGWSADILATLLDIPVPVPPLHGFLPGRSFLPGEVEHRCSELFVVYSLEIDGFEQKLDAEKDAQHFLGHPDVERICSSAGLFVPTPMVPQFG